MALRENSLKVKLNPHSPDFTLKLYLPELPTQTPLAKTITNVSALAQFVVSSWTKLKTNFSAKPEAPPRRSYKFEMDSSSVISAISLQQNTHPKNKQQILKQKAYKKNNHKSFANISSDEEIAGDQKVSLKPVGKKVARALEVGNKVLSESILSSVEEKKGKNKKKRVRKDQDSVDLLDYSSSSFLHHPDENKGKDEEQECSNESIMIFPFNVQECEEENEFKKQNLKRYFDISKVTLKGNEQKTFIALNSEKSLYNDLVGKFIKNESSLKVFWEQKLPEGLKEKSADSEMKDETYREAQISIMSQKEESDRRIEKRYENIDVCEQEKFQFSEEPKKEKIDSQKVVEVIKSLKESLKKKQSPEKDQEEQKVVKENSSAILKQTESLDGSDGTKSAISQSIFQTSNQSKSTPFFAFGSGPSNPFGSIRNPQTEIKGSLFGGKQIPEVPKINENEPEENKNEESKKKQSVRENVLELKQGDDKINAKENQKRESGDDDKEDKNDEKKEEKKEEEKEGKKEEEKVEIQKKTNPFLKNKPGLGINLQEIISGNQKSSESKNPFLNFTLPKVTQKEEEKKQITDQVILENKFSTPTKKYEVEPLKQPNLNNIPSNNSLPVNNNQDSMFDESEQEQKPQSVPFSVPPSNQNIPAFGATSINPMFSNSLFGTTANQSSPFGKNINEFFEAQPQVNNIWVNMFSKNPDNGSLLAAPEPAKQNAPQASRNRKKKQPQRVF